MFFHIYTLSQRSISTSSSLHHFEADFEKSAQTRREEFQSRSQSSMSLDSLGRAIQRVAEVKQEHNIDVEVPMEETEFESKEEKERRRKAYDTVSIADSTLG